MSQVMLIASMAKEIPDFAGDLIGVDKGALCCYQAKRAMVCAIGDFDSISESEFKAIESITPMITLPRIKNETDSEAAIQYAMEQGYEEIILYGGLGGRIDHELINIRMMIYRYPIIIMNEQNRCRYLKKGTYRIPKEYKYLSFIPMERSIITERGVAYPLVQRVVEITDLYTTSNEIIDEAEIVIHEGSFIMIECND